MDVLAVLDEAQDWLYRSSEGKGDDARAEAVKAACAAVAELIEASLHACEALRFAGAPMHADHLYTAITNVGSAS